MLNEIIQGIAIALHTEFGDGYEIYQNDVEQGLQEPCFFIAVLKPELSPLLKDRYFKRNPFDIHYFPKNSGDNAELYDAADRMLECIEFITLPDGDMLHGTEMSYEVVDDVLHFFVNFDHICKKQRSVEPMETVATDASVKLMGGLEWQQEEK